MFDDAGYVTRIGTLCQTEDAEELPATNHGWHFSGIHAIKRDGLQDVPDGFQCIVRSGYMKWVPEKEVSAMLHNGFGSILEHQLNTGEPTWQHSEVNLLCHLMAGLKPIPCVEKKVLGCIRVQRLKGISRLYRRRRCNGSS